MGPRALVEATSAAWLTFTAGRHGAVPWGVRKALAAYCWCHPSVLWTYKRRCADFLLAVVEAAAFMALVKIAVSIRISPGLYSCLLPRC